MWDELLEPDYGVDNSPPDGTRITQVILYFDKPEAEEFKRLCKAGIKLEFPQTYRETGNLSDFLLYILNRLYGSQKTLNGSAGVAVE
jgi:hypothetical protein